MQVKTHTLRRIALISAVSFGFSLPQAGYTRGLADAINAAQSQDWATAKRDAGRRDVIDQDLVEWHRLRAGEGSAQEVLDFLDRRSDWPGLALLRRRSEATIAQSNRRSILWFFDQVAPQTAVGALAYGEALIAGGRRGEGQNQIIQAWQTMAMPQSAHQAFIARHGNLLRDHHAARTD